MRFTEMIALALEGIWVNRLRSALTMLGMIIGVMFVIIIVTLGQSLNKQVAREVEGLGANSFTLVAVTSEEGQRGRLTLEDCRLLKSTVDGIDFVVPIMYDMAALDTSRAKKPGTLIGTSPDYIKVDRMGFNQGRFFNEAENQVGRRVVVISQKVADELFGSGSDVIGKTLRINRLPFQVCGVTKPQAALLGMEQTTAFIPARTMQNMRDDKEVQQALVRVKTADQLKAAAGQTVRILEMRHSVKGGFMTQTNEEALEQFSTILAVITSVFGALAGIALLVGGIGIMNIMLVSITERTREIGVRVALGARRRDILVQFLVEAATLAAIGGSAGMLLGIGIGALISLMLEMPVIISPGTILFAFAFSSAIGIIFGIYPANRAARLDPIDALRYE